MVRPAQGVYLAMPSAGDAIAGFQPWSEVVRRLTIAEQLSCLCSAFDAHLVARVFRGTRFEPSLPDWAIPAAVR
jgi:hypothetical protein